MSIIKIFFVHIILYLLINEIRPQMISTSTILRGRSRPISAVSIDTVAKPLRPTSISSTSSSTASTSSKIVNKDVKTKPNLFEEIDIHREREPLVENPKRVSFTYIDHREATQNTNGEQLDPLRDGVFARMHRILNQNAAPIAIGAVIGGTIGGVGVAGALELYNASSIINTYFSSKVVKNTTNISEEEILNRFD